MKQVVNRAAFTVSHKYATGESFQRNFQVGFDADAVIVRQLTYGGGTAATDVNMAIIQTDLIQTGDGVIGHIWPVNNAIGIPFAMSVVNNLECNIQRNKINTGTATFNMFRMNAASALVSNTTADGYLFLMLEFVKYS